MITAKRLGALKAALQAMRSAAFDNDLTPLEVQVMLKEIKEHVTAVTARAKRWQKAREGKFIFGIKGVEVQHKIPRDAADLLARVKLDRNGQPDNRTKEGRELRAYIQDQEDLAVDAWNRHQRAFTPQTFEQWKRDISE
jgi:hypothetical protein